MLNQFMTKAASVIPGNAGRGPKRFQNAALESKREQFYMSLYKLALRIQSEGQNRRFKMNGQRAETGRFTHKQYNLEFEAPTFTDDRPRW